jgi:hypothetical protein
MKSYRWRGSKSGPPANKEGGRSRPPVKRKRSAYSGKVATIANVAGSTITIWSPYSK